ncbi:MAG TPA: serine/threonine-protein kinase [Pseudomonadota bacterium]|nr:serine/threonine-protein kinase [Pseudomonadota bacterium]
MNPGDVLGNYRIVRLLGQGGMGSVYEAIHETIERRVALKVLHEGLAKDREAMNRFFNEARATNRIDHPSIVQVSDFGHTPQGAGYLVMEFLRGVSLAKRIADLGEHGEKMEPAVALQIAWQVADALTVAHGVGIVHRDLKPENLMLIDDPIAPSGERVKILDFGIAKLTQGNTVNKAHTAVNALMGTPVYMSPEQCEGAGGVDEKTDVYALGIILYEMLSGRPPFTAQGMGQLLMAHMTQTPPPLLSLVPGLKKDLAEFVHRLLVKPKAERPTMQQVHAMLSDLLVDVSGSVPAIRRRVSGAMGLIDGAPSRRSGRPPANNTLGQSLGQTLRTAAHRPMPLLGVVAACLLISGVAYLGLRGRRAPAQTPTTGPGVATVATPPAAVPPVEPKAAAAGKRVSWSLTSSPPGADVLDEAGTLLGQTPWQKEREAGDGQTVLRLRKRGYAEARTSLDNQKDSQKTLTLSAAAVETGGHSKGPSKGPNKKKKKPKGMEIED